jgi:hypothetical protein
MKTNEKEGELQMKIKWKDRENVTTIINKDRSIIREKAIKRTPQ